MNNNSGELRSNISISDLLAIMCSDVDIFLLREEWKIHCALTPYAKSKLTP